MKIIIYKGFPKEFYEKLVKKESLSNCEFLAYANILDYDKKYGRKLESLLVNMNDDDEKWIIYEEYVLIHDSIDIYISKYNLEVTIKYNNLFPDYYPIENINSVILEKLLEDNVIKNNKLDETLTKILNFYSTILKVNDNFYGSYYNYEYSNKSIKKEDYYDNKATISDLNNGKIDYEITINDDVLTYLRDLETLKALQCKSIALQSLSNEAYTNTNKRIAKSLLTFCYLNNITVYRSKRDEELKATLKNELINIAKNELKIPNFKDFRTLKFYKNPEFSNELYDISQDQLITEIITEAEKAYNNQFYKDIFITAPTGAGKSLLFQLSATYIAKKYHKLTIIIEPVISLMEDQKNALLKRGYTKVAAFNSTLITQIEREKVLNAIKNGDIDLLYLSPETLLSYSIESLIGDREIGLLIVDEAHIVTTWGIGFRPDYWYLGAYINRYRNGSYKNRKNIQKFPICAFTATAIYNGVDDSVNETCISLYMEKAIIHIGYCKRDDIVFEINVYDELNSNVEYEQKKAELLDKTMKKWISNKEKSIVYFPYARFAESAYHQNRNFSIMSYDKSCVGLYVGRNLANLNNELFVKQKQDTFDKFADNRINIMLATKAFGMGVDISDIINVYHYAATGNLSDYVQEIGRVARKKDLVGHACCDFFPNDSVFMNRLFGMSQIRDYQVKLVLSKLYEIYEVNKKRNFLINPDSFTFIFSSQSNDDSINKLKTTLLMLEKDFYDKYNYKVIISRPQSIFTKAYVVIDRECVNSILNSKYGSAFKFISNGRVKEPSVKDKESLISDKGDIYSIDLKYIWENFYYNMSFPQFKHFYFSNRNYEPSKIEHPILDDIYNYIYPRYRLTIRTINNLKLSSLREKILEDLDLITELLYKNFKSKYFVVKDFEEVLTEHFDEDKSKMIANSIFNLVDPDNKVIKERRNEETGELNYYISNGTFDSRVKKSILKSSLMHEISSTEATEFNKYISDGNLDIVALKLLSMLNYITYELIGGEEPEIFIRLNDPIKIENIVKKHLSYHNDYVTRAKEKHNRDVQILKKFFTELKNDEERWQYIEDYFLGKDVLK